ncbi:hypothetical protein JOY44_01055 [Phormidium sp. CLA17]|uniref:O-methyltransferase n=1 Tax=Leptolyngbya sp. Cla-17 TaxID=2803751 RepID=UPI001492C4A1|nr:O-methyltransferase [Leptolyngbya sp. Cla-17]MBM0740245.1 hypothetical protein [Leptolyngbya sp. Cla-17]
MTASYREINYILRPAKSIERKMLGEAFRCLSIFSPVDQYQYIGFGSTYFSDFYVFHKTLNIRKMYSIERDTNNKKRFEFNRPFGCIEICFGESNDILPTMQWKDTKSIVWLDYDYKLNESVISDIKTVFSSACSGSVIAISVNAEPAPVGDRFNELIRNVGEDRIPVGIDEKDFNKWNTANVYRDVINNEIQETIVNRNGGLDTNDKLIYRQLFNFHYEDNAKMLTVGGILYSRGQEPEFSRCLISQLEFVRTHTEPYLIKVPNFTYRELRYLDTQLPILNNLAVKLPGIPQSDIEAYSRIYRYFPMFAETEL